MFTIHKRIITGPIHIDKNDLLNALKETIYYTFSIQSIHNELYNQYTIAEIQFIIDTSLNIIMGNIDNYVTNIENYIKYLNELSENQDNIKDDRFKKFTADNVNLINEVAIKYDENKSKFKKVTNKKEYTYRLVENRSKIQKIKVFSDYKYSKMIFSLIDIIKLIMSFKNTFSTLQKLMSVKDFISKMASKFDKQVVSKYYFIKSGKNTFEIYRNFIKNSEILVPKLFEENSYFKSKIENLEKYDTTTNDPNNELLTLFIFTLSTMKYSGDSMLNDFVTICYNNFTQFYIIFVYVLTKYPTIKEIFLNCIDLEYVSDE